MATDTAAAERPSRAGGGNPLPRVLAFCDHYGPGTGGGAERVAHEVNRRLVGAGHAVEVVTTSGVAAWADGDGPAVHQVTTHDLSRRLGVQAALTRGATRTAGQIARRVRPDVLHAHSLQFATTIAAARLAARTGTPLVLTAHIAGFDELPQPLRTAALAHERLLGRMVVARTTRLIAVSEDVATHLRTWVPARTPIDVIPNGVDSSRFRPGTPRADGPLRVLVVGRLVPNKGVDQALAAVRALHARGVDATLTVVGSGPMAAALSAAAADWDHGHRVTFTGHSDAVADLMRAADVLVRPTQTEGMPLAVLEAMATGLPVIASDVPGNAALVRHEVTGLLVPPGDVGALTDALHRVATDPQLHRELAARALAASAAHSWDACAEATAAVLAAAARTTPASPTAPHTSRRIS